MDHLPEDVRAGLEAAARVQARKSRRLRLRVGERTVPVLRLWDDGFALAAETAEPIRGLVDIYDGEKQLARCLIVASRLENRELVFEYKHATEPTDRPPRDFAQEPDAPVALLPRD